MTEIYAIQSSILGTTITLIRLVKRGYISMFDHYCKVSPVLTTRLVYPELAEGYSGASTSSAEL